MSDTSCTFHFYFPNHEKPVYSFVTVRLYHTLATIWRAVRDELNLCGVVLSDFKMFKADIEIKPKETLRERTLQWLHSRSPETMLNVFDFIETHFPNGPHPPEKGSIDIIIATGKTLEHLDILSDPIVIQPEKCREVREEQISRIRKTATPSEIIKSSSLITSLFEGEDTFIHIGRPSGNHGPPTVLFHPTLAKLKKYLDQPEQVHVPHNTITHSRTYVELSADTYKDEMFR